MRQTMAAKIKVTALLNYRNWGYHKSRQENYLQAAHLQTEPCQVSIKYLKHLKFEAIRNISGSSFHKLAVAYLIDFSPYLVVMGRGTCTVMVYLKEYSEFFNEIRSLKYVGPCLCNILYVSYVM